MKNDTSICYNTTRLITKYFCTSPMTRKILAASLAVLFTVSMVFVGFTNDVQGHSIPEVQIDKSFIL